MIKKRFLFLAIAIVVGALHTFEVEAVPDSIFGVPFHQSSHGSIGAHVTDFCEKFISVCTCVTCTSPGTCQRILDTVDPGSKMDQGLSVPIDDPGAQWTQDFIDSQPEPQTPRLVFPSLDPGADILFTDLPDPMDCWLDTVYNAGDHNDERLGPNYTHDTTSPSAQLSESTYPTRLPHIATESDLMDIGDATSDTSNQNFTVSDRRLQKGGSAISPAPTPSGESLDRDDADNSYPLQDHRSSIASMSPSPSVPPSHNHSTDQTLFRSPNSPPSLLATPSPVPVPQPAPSAQGKLQCPQCEKCFLKQSLLRAHVKRQHDRNAKRIKCPVINCPFTTIYPKDLKKHEPTHTNARDFCCEKCDSSFTRRDNLNRHVLDKHPISSN